MQEPNENKNAGIQANEQPARKKKKSKGMPTVLKVILIIVVILLAIFLVLYLTAWIAGFDSVAALLDTLGADLGQVGSEMQANGPPSIN